MTNAVAIRSHLARGLYAGLDVAWPYLLEANMYDPDGLARALILIGVDHSPKTVPAILESLRLT
jgi:hypothetical protein